MSDHLTICFFHSRQCKGKTIQLLFIRSYLTQNQLNHLKKLLYETGLEDTETSKTPDEANWNKPCKNN